MLYMLSMHDNGFLSKLLYIIVIICAIYIFIKDYSLLPFLGKSAFPSTVIVDEKYPKNYTYQHVLKLPDVEDGRKIIYWAAKQDKDNKKIIPKTIKGISAKKKFKYTLVSPSEHTGRIIDDHRYREDIGRMKGRPTLGEMTQCKRRSED